MDSNGARRATDAGGSARRRGGEGTRVVQRGCCEIGLTRREEVGALALGDGESEGGQRAAGYGQRVGWLRAEWRAGAWMGQESTGRVESRGTRGTLCMASLPEKYLSRPLAVPAPTWEAQVQCSWGWSARPNQGAGDPQLWFSFSSNSRVHHDPTTGFFSCPLSSLLCPDSRPRAITTCGRCCWLFAASTNRRLGLQDPYRQKPHVQPRCPPCGC